MATAPRADHATGDATRTAGARPWLGLIALLLPTLAVTTDLSVLFLATPQLAADLRPDSTQLLWIIDIYGFTIAGFLVTMGALGDRIGRRRLLLIGAAAFAVGSALAAYAASAQMLILVRGLLGIAGATLMPATLALISSMFARPEQRAFAIGVWMTTMSVGISVGPLIGGALLESFWWGAVFLVNVPVMVLFLVAAPLLLPERRDRSVGRIDVISSLLLLAAIMPIVHGLKALAGGTSTPTAVVALIAGGAAGAVLVRRQRRLPRPLLDLRLFSRPAFGAALALLFVGMVAINGVEYLFPQHLQMVEGLSPWRAGLWTIPGALAVIAGSLLAPVLARTIAPGRVVAAGALVAAAGFVLIAQVSGSNSFGVLVAGLVVAQLGIAPILVLGTDLVVGSAPPAEAGAASAVSETSAELGVAMGIAVMGAVGTAVYRGRMAGLQLPGTSADAAAAGDTLAGAVTVADELPAGAGAELLQVAHAAFARGFGVAATVAAVLGVGLSAMAFVWLRDVRPLGVTSGRDDLP